MQSMNLDSNTLWVCWKSYQISLSYLCTLLTELSLWCHTCADFQLSGFVLYRNSTLLSALNLTRPAHNKSITNLSQLPLINIFIVNYYHVEGDFYDKPRQSGPIKGERADKIVHADNIRLEGNFSESTTSRQDFQTSVSRGERYDVKKYEDQLQMGGEFTSTTVNREMYQTFKGERADVRRPIDNLKPEGKIRSLQDISLLILRSRYQFRHERFNELIIKSVL